VSSADTAASVLEYVLERLRAQLLESGVPNEHIDAVLSVGVTRPLDVECRLEALKGFLHRDEAASLAAANKRIANLLKKSSLDDAAGAIDVARFAHPAERALHAALETLTPALHADLAAARYDAALTALAGLRTPIDAFFADVMVNDPDTALRANRLALVARVRACFLGVADLSKLPG
jgi:glycyl-tRNA synthetase beta chain